MPKRNRTRLSFTLVSAFLATTATAISLAALVGWAIDSELLMSVGKGYVSMKPNTAMGLLLLGVSNFGLAVFSHHRRVRQLASLLSLTVSAMGLLTMIQYMFTVDLRIDQLLFAEAPNAPWTWSPGRMAAITCLCFILLGLVLHAIAAGYKRLSRLPDYLSLASGFVAIFVLLGYLYDTASLRNLGMYGGMAVHTAIGFLLLSIAMPMLRPEKSLLRPLFSGGPAGLVMRFILPAAVLGPVAVGLLRQFGEGEGYFSHGEGLALEVVTTILVLVVLTLVAAQAVQRSSQAARRAQDVVQRFFDLSNNLLCIANMDGYFVRINRAWERTLGYSSEELTTQPFQEFLHPDDVEPTRREYERQAAGCDVMSFENRYRCKDGSFRTLLWNATPPADNGFIYASAHDITGRKEAEQQIAELNEALGARAVALEATNAELEAFSYSVSHDLRAPLRSIDGFSQALLEDCFDRLDEQGKDFLMRVRASTQRMGQLIDDLLELSRVTRSSFNPEAVDLSALAKGIVNTMREKYRHRHVEIEVVDRLVADCDPRLMTIVLENLLDNAWKYTARQERAVIRFEAVTIQDVTTYVVSDNGVGFDSTYIGKLFQPFQRLHGQEEFEGTGIGLATVKRIIARHGGTVWAQGNPEHGAAFFFTLAPGNLQGDAYARESDITRRGQSGRRRVDAARS